MLFLVSLQFLGDVSVVAVGLACGPPTFVGAFIVRIEQDRFGVVGDGAVVVALIRVNVTSVIAGGFVLD